MSRIVNYLLTAAAVLALSCIGAGSQAVPVIQPSLQQLADGPSPPPVPLAVPESNIAPMIELADGPSPPPVPLAVPESNIAPMIELADGPSAPPVPLAIPV